LSGPRDPAEDTAGCRIRRDKTAEAVGVVARAEIVVTGFGVAFFAGEFVGERSKEQGTKAFSSSAPCLLIGSK